MIRDFLDDDCYKISMIDDDRTTKTLPLSFNLTKLVKKMLPENEKNVQFFILFSSCPCCTLSILSKVTEFESTVVLFRCGKFLLE